MGVSGVDNDPQDEDLLESPNCSHDDLQKRHQSLSMGSDGGQERPDPHDLDHPFHVVGEHMQAHLGTHPLYRSGEEVGCPHP